jgi:hypothetical protein
MIDTGRAREDSGLRTTTRLGGGIGAGATEGILNNDEKKQDGCEDLYALRTSE